MGRINRHHRVAVTAMVAALALSVLAGCDPGGTGADDDDSTTAASTGAATDRDATWTAAADIATVRLVDGPTFEFTMDECTTSTSDPDFSQLPDSYAFSVHGENADPAMEWTSPDGVNYFGSGTIRGTGDNTHLVRFEPGLLTLDGDEISGDVVFHTLGGELDGIRDSANGTISLSC